MSNGTFSLSHPIPLLPIFSNTKKGFFYNEVLLKNILSLTLTLGCKNKKRPSGPLELDLEAGNLVLLSNINFYQLVQFHLSKFQIKVNIGNNLFLGLFLSGGGVQESSPQSKVGLRVVERFQHLLLDCVLVVNV